MSRSIQHERTGRVAIVGAGMVGLSTAWFLQDYGVETVVFESGDVASGTSWGNAGWLSPSLVAPLPEPAALKYGLRAMASPSAPVYVPLSWDPKRLRFLVQFARNCTHSRWERAMSALVPLNEAALAAFEMIEDRQAGLSTQPAEPLLAAYSDEQLRDGLIEEFRHLQAAGQPVDYHVLSGDEARSMEPTLSAKVVSALQINGQRFLNPAAFVRSLGDVVKGRGGEICTETAVGAIKHSANGVSVAGQRFDAAVIATGARLQELARPVGVKRLVQAGRGYSFTVAADHLPKGPLYLPAQRIACTPVGKRLRIAGMMELRPADAPLDQRRIAAIKNAAAPLLRGVDLEDRQDEWVGSRPCTADGLPLIGRSRNPRVFIAGGHGMWGMTLGPVTGKLIAQQIVTGTTPDALRAVNPLR